MTRSVPTLRRYERARHLQPIALMWKDALSANWPIQTAFLGRVFDELTGSDCAGCEVALVEDVPVGVIAWHQNPHALTQAALVFVLVDVRRRRHGIGTALVTPVLESLRARGVTAVVLGEWAYPQFWHGVPVDCRDGLEFFRSLGWTFHEETSDLVSDLGRFEWPIGLRERLAAHEVTLRAAIEDDRPNILSLVRREHPSFMGYYQQQLDSHGPHRIRIAYRHNQLQAAIILATAPDCPGAQWRTLLGDRLCTISALLVAASARRRGIGLGLCAYALEEFQRSRYATCYLEWITLVHMYERLGARVWRRYRQGRLVLETGAPSHRSLFPRL